MSACSAKGTRLSRNLGLAVRNLEPRSVAEGEQRDPAEKKRGETSLGNSSRVGESGSELHHSVYCSEKRGLNAVVHVGDFLCIGGMECVMWLFDTLKTQHDLKKHLLARVPADPFAGAQVRQARRGTAMNNDMARDRPELAMTARLPSQRVAVHLKQPRYA